MQGFILNGEEFFLEYENLHLLCVHCGVYGLRSETCQAKRNSKEGGRLQESLNREEEGQTSRRETVQEPVVEEGQWRVAHKTRRQRKPRDTNRMGQSMKQGGTRFDVLVEATEETEMAGNTMEVGHDDQGQVREGIMEKSTEGGKSVRSKARVMGNKDGSRGDVRPSMRSTRLQEEKEKDVIEVSAVLVVKDQMVWKSRKEEFRKAIREKYAGRRNEKRPREVDDEEQTRGPILLLTQAEEVDDIRGTQNYQMEKASLDLL